MMAEAVKRRFRFVADNASFEVSEELRKLIAVVAGFPWLEFGEQARRGTVFAPLRHKLQEANADIRSGEDGFLKVV